VGALVLADRVNGADYTVEELELLQCIADQMTSVLLNLRLANEVARARELEAFRTMSAFFVHDLKNAAASLNLMLKNLPVHFDDPAFREDALRGVGNTARRIDEMIARLSALRQRPDVKPVEADLNELVSEAVERLDGMPDVELTKELQPLPGILADREQIQSVVTNLLLNARDAVGPGGRIQVRTDQRGGRVVLSVADNGCGMSPAFLKDSLFLPFQSTKTKGLGIGMFQSRMIVEAHGGSIQVESETGKGTTVRVSLPAMDAT
jgi:putative PEP-CTERM system histidine kinase